MKKIISIVMTLVMLVSYSLVVDAAVLCITFERSKPSTTPCNAIHAKKSIFHAKSNTAEDGKYIITMEYFLTQRRTYEKERVGNKK